MPKVSVIVPAYNVENYIEKCINSLVNQTLKEIEIIIVNDGSKDKTKEKIMPYISKYPDKIKYLEKENGGLSSARNFGMPYATGEYIAFLDSDDYVEKDMYDEMYKKAKEENSDMVECDFIWEYPNKIKKDIGVLSTNKKDLIVKNRVVAWNKLIKRDIIEMAKIEFPHGLRYEDVEFFYKLVPYLNKVSLINKCFIHYVQRDNSIVNTQNSRTKEIFQVLDNVIEYYKEKNLYEEYKQELEYIYARFLLCSSLKRMLQIKDKKERKDALNQTWTNLNTKFPNWENNQVLKKDKSLKNTYIRLVGLLKKIKLIPVKNEEKPETLPKDGKTKMDFLQYLICAFIILSPILDMISFIFRNKFNTSWSPSTILRPIVPVIAFMYLFFKQAKKKKVILVSILYVLYAATHMHIFSKIMTGISYGGIKEELQYIINYTFMILVLYVMSGTFKGKNIDPLKKSVLIAVTIYVVSIFLSIITKTSSTTYLEGTGYKGWFESGNSLCTLLCIGLCIILPMIKKEKKAIFELIVFILTGLYLVVFSGTRTGLLGVILIGLSYLVSKLLFERKEEKRIKKKIFFVGIGIFVFSTIIIVVFGMQTIKRRTELKENEYNNVDPDTGVVRNVSGDILSLYKQIQNGEVSEEYLSKEAQESICQLCMYAKKTNMSNVDLRKQQLVYNLYLVRNQKNIFLILFGNGYKAQFRELVMEMEIPAIICNFGLIGFALYLGPFLVIWGYGVYNLLRNIKSAKQENVMYVAGMTLGLALSGLAGYTFFNQSSMIIVCTISVLILETQKSRETTMAVRK